MEKTMKCGDLMPGCTFVAQGETEDEILQEVAAHARDVHGIEEVTDDLVAQVRSRIKTA